ncbi:MULTISPECIES: superoxide dismutase family protein [Halomonadaceae]|uniref:Superoxide dismutase family protein n=1 Tax=Vreelandella malpeensis TaxID=1172368 RepID=A0ABS8DSP7_9GAMM|nr:MULTISPECIES: superoxide dismutase family protein [Halomonas]MCB8889063.1 superoxide dismutase family protein [Halomonas malpeensis]MCP1312970.1 superoxide dismutase [Cu-Zn] SodC [Halomonas sp. 707D7]MCP1325422.1 superoxide dismutase [Cu-Zn] SodC [Halomonas sp. 707D4]
MRLATPLTAITAALLLATTAHAQSSDSLEVNMHDVTADGVGEAMGTVTIESSEFGGVMLTPSVTGLEPGIYGFHLHQNPSCEPAEDDDGEMAAAQAAGGHYDPEGTETHQGPYGEGHLGDLPVLTVNEDGEANLPVLAPRLSMEDMTDRALIIHEGGDTYADEPHLGGGGARMLCGVTPAS